MRSTTWSNLRQRWSLISSSHLFTNSVLFSANTLVVAIFSALFWWMTARLYKAEVVGLLVVIVSAGQLITTVSQFGLGFSIVRFLPGVEDKPAFINTAFVLAFLSTLTVTIIVVAFGPIVLPHLTILQQDTFVVLTFLISIPILALSQVLYQVLAATRAAHLIFLQNLGVGISRLALLLAAQQFTSTGMLILVFALPIAIAVTFVLLIALPTIIPNYSLRRFGGTWPWRRMAGYSLTSCIGNLLHDLPYQLLPQLIANRGGLADAGYFYVPWSMFGMLTTIGSSLSLSLFVEGSNNRKRMDMFARVAIFWAGLVATFGAFVTLFIAFPILSFFGASYAQNGTQLLQVLAIASIPATLLYLIVSLQRVKDRLSSVNVAYGIIVLISLSVSMLSAEHPLAVTGLIWLAAQVIALAYLTLDYYKKGQNARP